MKTTLKNLALCLAIGLVAACVQSRSPELVAMKQDGDNNLTCQALAIEYKSNTAAAEAKIKVNHRKDKKEIWKILLWPGLADNKNADGAEGNAQLDRNLRIIELAKAKQCNVNAWPAQPARYK